MDDVRELLIQHVEGSSEQKKKSENQHTAGVAFFLTSKIKPHTNLRGFHMGLYCLCTLSSVCMDDPNSHLGGPKLISLSMWTHNTVHL